MARRAKGDGTLRKRKDGRWEGWFNIGKDENGKIIRKSVTAKTKTECQEKLNAAKEKYFAEQQILSGHKYLTSSEPTLAEWYEIWINAFCKGVIKNYTEQWYEQRFRLYILPELGEMKLNEISTVVCQQFFVNLLNNGRIRGRKSKGNGLSIYTVKGIERTLSVCLEKAVDEDLLSKNPCTKVKLPNIKKPEMQTLKKEDLAVFLEETKRCDCYEFYYLELTTGMRLGEICALTWDDLDIENKTISINKSVQRVNNEIVVNTPKTKSSMQTMLRLVGFGDNAGSGFSKILSAWADEGWTTPQIYEDTVLNQVKLTLSFKSEDGKNFNGTENGTESGTENDTEKSLTDRQKKIISLIKNEPKISKSKLAKELNLSSGTINREISKLKSLGVLIRVGPDKGGHWEIIL